MSFGTIRIAIRSILFSSIIYLLPIFLAISPGSGYDITGTVKYVVDGASFIVEPDGASPDKAVTVKLAGIDISDPEKSSEAKEFIKSRIERRPILLYITNKSQIDGRGDQEVITCAAYLADPLHQDKPPICLNRMLLDAGYAIPRSGPDEEFNIYGTFPTYETIYKEIDSSASKVPEDVRRSVDDLASYLIKPAKNDRETVRVIYRWITQNIDYDTISYFSNNFSDQGPESVLLSGKAVCAGYANLFERMASVSGLEAVKISGSARKYNYSLNISIQETMGHAWNAVKLDGKWYLIDCTWGAGSVDSLNRTFNRTLNDFYFLSPPDEFIYSHLPEDPKWQLLESPISQDDFEHLALLRPYFFSYGLELDDHKACLVDAESEIGISLIVPRDVEVSADLERDGIRLPGSFAMARRHGNRYMIQTAFPSPGRYMLLVFACRAGDSSYDSVMSYIIDAKSGISDSMGYPEIYNAADKYGVELDSHKYGTIRSDGRANITLLVPSGVNLTADIKQDGRILPRSLISCKRDGGTYIIKSIYPHAGTYNFIIYARGDNETENYKGVIKYRIESDSGVEGFIGFPEERPGFYKYGLALNLSGDGLIGTGHRLSLNLTAPEDIIIQSDLKYEGKLLPESFTSIKKRGNSYNMQAAFPYAGNYTAIIYAKRCTEEGALTPVLTYDLEIDKGETGLAPFPKIYGRFAYYDLELDSNPYGIIKTSGMANVTLKVPRDIALIASLKSGNKVLPVSSTFAQRAGDKYEILAAFPGAGNYTLTIYAKRLSDPGDYHPAIEYLVESAGGLGINAGFPKAYGKFHEINAHLYCPLKDPLPSGTRQFFKIEVPGARNVSIINWGKWSQLQKNREIFEGEVDLGRGSTKITADFYGNNSYDRIVEYSPP